jgi:uncharacterized OB-fold protein
MSRAFEVAVCTSCSQAAFPPRPVCSSCGGREWEREVADSGVVEERTWRFHRTREERRVPVHGWRDLRRVPIAFVRLDRGPSVVAWSPDDVAIGAQVRMELSSGVPVAREL